VPAALEAMPPASALRIQPHPIRSTPAGLQWERWRRAHLDDLLGGMSPMEFILRFTFTNPDLDTTIARLAGSTVAPSENPVTGVDIITGASLARRTVNLSSVGSSKSGSGTAISSAWTISSGAQIIPMSNPPSPGAGKSLRGF
jgi:hypothetical protein